MRAISPKLLLLSAAFALAAPATAQKILWQKAIGGSGYDNGYAMINADHGCYFMAGTTSSNNGLGQGNHSIGKFDIIVTKVSAEGQVVWKTLIGGSGNEEYGEMRTTPDGGLVLIGTTESLDGDATSNHGKMDILLARLDRFGKLLWTRCYGGTGNDKGATVQPLEDGGYLIGGESGSRNGTMTYHHGGLDAWAARLDVMGNVVVEKSLGGKGNETVRRFMEIRKDRFLVICTSNSVDGDVKEFLGEKDVWTLCLSKNFDIVWQHAYGGSMFDEAHDVIRLSGGDFIVCGTTFSEDKDLELTTYSGYGDSWLFRISDQGNLRWSKCYGGSKSEGGNGVAETPDGGLVMVGTTNSKDKIVPGTKGLYDGWIVRTDSTGKTIWTGTFGGEDFEYLYAVEALKDGNYLAVGFAESVKGDLLPLQKEVGNDLWFLRFSDPEDTRDNVQKSSPYLTGLVYNGENGTSVPATVIITNNDNLAKVNETRAGGDGRYEMDLPQAGKFSVMFTASGFMFYGEDLDYGLLANSPEIRLDVKLDPIKIGSKVILKLIYFDTGKWDLRPESEPELRRLEQFLKANPDVKVEISGHTDNTGSATTKKELSENRATKVRDWLLKAGVSGRQMSVMGYGQDRPIADNATEEGRAKNRRVEVEVIELLK